MKQLLPFAFLFFAVAALAQNDSAARKGQLKLLPLPASPDFSISPDYATIRMSNFDGRWYNMLGGNIPLAAYTRAGNRLTLAASGYMELHDIAQEQFMSWQLWRGNLGVDFYYEPQLSSPQHHLRLGYILHHESQHATDFETFSAYFLKQPDTGFKNGSARSFEYNGLEIKHEWTAKKPVLTLYNRLLLRYFTVPLLEDATRQQTGAFALESGVRIRVAEEDGVWVYAQGFYEQIHNNFVAAESPYRGNWNKQPLKYLQGEIGLWLVPRESNRSLNFFLRWGRSQGRGLDFTREYSGMGWGFRFNL